MSTYLNKVTSKPDLLPPRIVLYGRGKVGKNTFACSALKPVVLPYEQGAGLIAVPTLPVPDSHADGMNMLHELATEKHDYKTIILDSLDANERKYIFPAASEHFKKSSVVDVGYNKGYEYAIELWINWFDALDALRRKGMTVIVIGHEEMKQIDDVELGSFHKVQPRMNAKSKGLLVDWADIVAHLGLERVKHTHGDKGSRQVTTSIATGTRNLRLQESIGIEAGNRYSLPEVIKNIPKTNGYAVLRAELRSALGLDKPKTTPKAAPKEAA